MSKMSVESILRLCTTVGLIAMQILLIVALVIYMQTSAVAVYILLELLSGIAIVALVSKRERATYRYTWVVCVLFTGVFGVVLYLFWGNGGRQSKLGRRIKKEMSEVGSCLKRKGQTIDSLARAYPESVRLANYLDACGCPVYQGTHSAYFASGEAFFASVLSDIEEATRCIYLEFFIVAQGEIMDELLRALARKTAQGVDVRMIWDDMGSLGVANPAFIARLEKAGIKAVMFNQINRYVHQLSLNFRDHRKIVAIDGRIAYTGGMNIADEYVNRKERFGYWKDTGVRLEGQGARSFHVFFLKMWAAISERSEPELFDLPIEPLASVDGFVQPYQDGPYNAALHPAHAVYHSLISGAKHYIYVTTPYLILDEDMDNALCMAAHCGVDVRICVPGIPDHPTVYRVSASFFEHLMDSGVRIYRYTPGFLHAKMCVADDAFCSVGTVNMDYRSLYMHNEDGVLFVGGDMAHRVRADIEEIMEQGEELSLEKIRQSTFMQRFLQGFFKILAPMM